MRRRKKTGKHENQECFLTRNWKERLSIAFS